MNPALAPENSRYSFLRHQLVRASTRNKTVTDYIPHVGLQKSIRTGWIFHFQSILSNIRLHLPYVLLVFECIETIVKINDTHIVEPQIPDFFMLLHFLYYIFI